MPKVYGISLCVCVTYWSYALIYLVLIISIIYCSLLFQITLVVICKIVLVSGKALTEQNQQAKHQQLVPNQHAKAQKRIGYDYPAPSHDLVNPFQDHDDLHSHGDHHEVTDHDDHHEDLHEHHDFHHDDHHHIEEHDDHHDHHDHHDPGYWKKKLIWKPGWKKIWKKAKKQIWKPSWKKIWKPIWVPTKIPVYKDIKIPDWKKIWKPEWKPIKVCNASFFPLYSITSRSHSCLISCCCDQACLIHC